MPKCSIFNSLIWLLFNNKIRPINFFNHNILHLEFIINSDNIIIFIGYWNNILQLTTCWGRVQVLQSHYCHWVYLLGYQFKRCCSLSNILRNCGFFFLLHKITKFVRFIQLYHPSNQRSCWSSFLFSCYFVVSFLGVLTTI